MPTRTLSLFTLAMLLVLLITPSAGGEDPCIRVQGFSQTHGMLIETSGAYEESTNSGAAIEIWSNTDYRGWTETDANDCGGPDVLVQHVSGVERTQASWEAQLETYLANTEALRPDTTYLMAVIGHVDDGCTDVRANQNHPLIHAAIQAIAAGHPDVEVGPKLVVSGCGLFSDDLGHLTTAGSQEAAAQFDTFFGTPVPTTTTTTEPPGGGTQVPSAPTGLTAGSVTGSTVELAWTDTSSGSSQEDGFEIQRRTQTTAWTIIDSTGADVSDYTDYGVEPQTTYGYQVRAFNGAGTSPWSTWIRVTTTASEPPTTTTLPPGNQPPTAVDDLATTEVDQPVTIPVLANDSDPNGDDLTVASVTQPGHGNASTNAATVTYTPDLGFEGADEFTYTVADPDGAGDTATVTVTVASQGGATDTPAAPTDLGAGIGTGGSIELTWTDTSSGSNQENGFEIQRRTRTTSWVIIAVTGADATGYTDSSVDPSTTYGYQVRAFNDVGTSAWSTWTRITAPN